MHDTHRKLLVLLVVPRSSDQRLALVERVTKRLSLLTDTNDVVLNFAASHLEGHEARPFSNSLPKTTEGMKSKSESKS